MMIREVWKEAVMAKFQVLRRLFVGTEQNYDNISGYSVLEPKFEPGATRIRSRNVAQWTVTFSDELILAVCLYVYVPNYVTFQ